VEEKNLWKKGTSRRSKGNSFKKKGDQSGNLKTTIIRERESQEKKKKKKKKQTEKGNGRSEAGKRP